MHGFNIAMKITKKDGGEVIYIGTGPSGAWTQAEFDSFGPSTGKLISFIQCFPTC